MFNNLGTIVQVCTKVCTFSFFLCLNTHGVLGLHGQFSVCFYSAYLFAEAVQVIKESAAGGTFITPDTVNPPFGRDSEIRLYLKEDQLEYLEEKKIMEIVKKHSEFISYSIQLAVTKEVEEDHLACQLEFKAILFIPKRAPFDLFESKKKHNNIKLYVRRVFIMDDCEDLILNFVKGIVDSENLPLNISRETLQQNKILKVIRKNIVKKRMDVHSEIAKDKDNFAKFYEAISKNLKLGIHEDAQNHSKLAEFLRFFSTKSTEEQISLKGILHHRVPEIQKSIYYLTGESLASVRDSPFLEVLKKKGFEVLLLVDPIDEHAITQLKEFDSELICVSKEGLKLEEMVYEEKAREDKAAAFTELCTTVNNALGDKVEKVVILNRITDSPCVVDVIIHGFKKKNLKLNPNNAIVKELKRKAAEDKGGKYDHDLTYLLFETALLTSGFVLDEPTSFAKPIHRMISLGLDVDEDEEEVAAVEGDNAPPPLEGTSTSAMEEID
ncbi:hypothetical protein C8F04DRAFT_1321421 [Mycena alexandri]|uniref:Heat shock protein 90 n=1 Tax=Mycena alexandri TaxID=1745969 RepID=A0AAD6X6X0_9AGAR|nr:hypothetical protein C8F04DRAFT_1321421 [Mycena alexandri]